MDCPFSPLLFSVFLTALLLCGVQHMWLLEVLEN